MSEDRPRPGCALALLLILGAGLVALVEFGHARHEAEMKAREEAMLDMMRKPALNKP